jgi:hypothetical protein
MVQLLAAFGAVIFGAANLVATPYYTPYYYHPYCSPSLKAWLDAVADWPSFRIAVSIGSHRDLAVALRLGRIDPDECAGSFMEVVATCGMSGKLVELVRLAFCGWSPLSHWLHSPAVREAVLTTLATAARFDEDEYHELALPPELWLVIFSFLKRGSWASGGQQSRHHRV